MKLLGEEFIAVNPQVEETVKKDMPPWDLCCSLAAQKAKKVAEQYSGEVILGADTIVSIRDKILGKPKNREEAVKMLRFLSGQEHRVYTGVCLIKGTLEERFFEETKVRFHHLSDKEIIEYAATGEPMDKAGAYAIQGYGARFVRKIEGDFYNVVGLPVSAVYQKLKELNNQQRAVRKPK